MAITFVNAQNTKVTTTNDSKKVTTANDSKKATTANDSKKTTAVNDTKKTTLKVTELQKSITDNIAKDYPGYKAIEAYKLDKKGSISFEVLVSKDTSNINLFYSKNGVFLRKEKPVATKKVEPVNTKQSQGDKPKTTTGDKPKTSKR